MSVKLVILSLLKDKPMYGYEIKRIIEEHMGDWTSIAFGSIYFALDKMCSDGLVDKVAEEKIGKRPSRLIYSITDKGKKEIFSLLREIFTSYEREYYPLDIALAFCRVLPNEEVTGYLKARIESISENLKYLKVHKKETIGGGKVPGTAKAVFMHAEFHLNAELNWLKKVCEDFESGELS